MFLFILFVLLWPAKQREKEFNQKCELDKSTPHGSTKLRMYNNSVHWFIQNVERNQGFYEVF